MYCFVGSLNVFFHLAEVLFIYWSTFESIVIVDVYESIVIVDNATHSYGGHEWLYHSFTTPSPFFFHCFAINDGHSVAAIFLYIRIQCPHFTWIAFIVYESIVIVVVYESIVIVDNATSPTATGT